jgi:hypothetical protein
MKRSWRVRYLPTLVLAVVLALSSSLAAQPPTAAAQDGFVPVSRATQQETIPAARLVVIAYGFAWVMLIGYLWSIWTRIGKVERDLHDVSRRIGTGER